MIRSRISRWLAGASLALAPVVVRAQALTGAAKWADSARVAIDAAVRAGDPDAIAAARALTERALVAYPKDGLLLHYRGYALYAESNARAARGGDSHALLEEADKTLEKAEAALPLPESFAIHSAVLGQLIAFDPPSGMTLGPASQGLMQRAEQLGPSNPRIWMLSGISTMLTPEMYGGSVQRGQEKLKRAVALFETDHPAPPLPAWGRADAYVWLGQSYEKLNKTDSARASYKQALAIAPNSRWAQGLLAKLDGGSKE